MKHAFSLALFVLLFGAFSQAQQKVTGTITSAEDGGPLAFATINVQGFPQAVASSSDNGTYSIAIPNGGSTLVFSFFGMKSKEVLINGQSIVNVSLENDEQTLDETIVVAYGTAKKGTFTGSAAVLKADKLQDMPVASFQDALSGQIAGLQLSSGSGQVGSTSSIRIRGTGSMKASNEPLYVIDGVPVISGDLTQLSSVSNNVMATLNPNDIETFTVLKDAAASALYGSRAANGVILITTKKGSAGKPRVALKTTLGFTPSYASKNFESVSPEQNEKLIFEQFYNEMIDAGKSHEEAGKFAQGKVDYYAFKDPRGYFDWEKALFRTGAYQNYDLSVSGGSESTKYFTSVAYMKEKGRSISNSLDRISSRFNFSQKIGKFVEFGSNINIAKTKKEGFNDSRHSAYNYFYAVKNLLLPNYWPDDKEGNPITTRYPSYSYNLIHFGPLDTRNSDMFKLFASEYISISILDGLKFRSVFNYDLTRVDDTWWQSPDHINATTTQGRIDEYSTQYVKLLSSNILTYDKTFFEDHSISLLAGYEAERNPTKFLRASGTGFPNSLSNTVATTGVKDANGYSWGYNMLSYLAKADYSYMNKYYLSASYRRDGSSRFGANSRWGNFWSLSGSWRIINESFLKNVSWLNDLRIKASYGVNGTLPLSNYAHLALFSFQQSYDGNTAGLVSNAPDPNLTWETNYTWNLALEAQLANRLSVNLEVYNRDSKNLLQDVPLSRITGFSKTLTNFGEMNNKGVDLELKVDIFRQRDWNWTLGLNLSTFKTKITKLYDGEDVPDGLYIFREGYSPNSFYVQEWAGVDPATGNPQWYSNKKLADGSLDKSIVNKRTGVNSAEYILYDKADPDVFGGLSSMLSWKNISLNMVFAYSFGGLSYDNTARDREDDGYYNARIMAKSQWNRWTTPGQVTNTPRRTYDQNTGQGYQSRHIHSSDHIRLKNLVLSYSLPQNLVKKVYLSNARVFFSSSNIFTWAKHKDYDPEVNARGLRGWEMPLGKTYTFGVELDF